MVNTTEESTYIQIEGVTVSFLVSSSKLKKFIPKNVCRGVSHVHEIEYQGLCSILTATNEAGKYKSVKVVKNTADLFSLSILLFCCLARS